MRYSKSSILTDNTIRRTDLPFLYLALPVMDEPDHLPVLLKCLSEQTNQRFKLVACVNQPDEWWVNPGKLSVCLNNTLSVNLLNDRYPFETEVIDRSSRGKGWQGKQHGVGFARKTIMDHINQVAHDHDVIVSIDADTTFTDNYLHSLAINFSKNPDVVAMAVPYFHQTPEDPVAARAMLRYEIYMRHYFLNLVRIGSPYAFTALGSAMAIPVWAYRAVRGMTPKLSGEDFYFLQKLRKFGNVLIYNDEVVCPASRFSDRVYFGTGPAMIKGATGDWSSYPVYPTRFFDEIRYTYQILPELFHTPVETPVISFMAEVFREADPIEPLRRNNADLPHFIRGFHEKFDGLRILQFLKRSNELNNTSDEENLAGYLKDCWLAGESEQIVNVLDRYTFRNIPLPEMEKIRIYLYQKEMTARATAVLL